MPGEIQFRFCFKVFQTCFAFLETQTGKNLPIMGEIQSLGWEDPLEKGMATHSSILT